MCDQFMRDCQLGLEEKRKEARILAELVCREELPSILKAIKVFDEWVQFMIKSKSSMLKSPTYSELVSIFRDFLNPADETSSKLDEIDEELMFIDRDEHRK